MKRYFDIVGKDQTLMLDIVDNSEAAMCTSNEIGKNLKMNLREITKSEYTKLSKKYTK